MKTMPNISSVEDYAADAAEDPDSLSIVLSNDAGITLDANVDYAGWHDLLTPDFQTKMMAILGDAMAREGHANLDIAILFADAEKLAQLNADHRRKDGATDVLSFPADDDDFLGDIAIAFEVMASQAHDMGITKADHCLHLLLHGALHLSGHDHMEDDDAAVMENLEIAILADHGIANPYAGSLSAPNDDDGDDNGGAV